MHRSAMASSFARGATALRHRHAAWLALALLAGCEPDLPAASAARAAPPAAATLVSSVQPSAASPDPGLDAVEVAPQPTAAVPRAHVEQAYPLHGLTVAMQAHVFAEPNSRATEIGYMRRGARFRAQPGISGPGCETRWHALHAGGFVCTDRGVLIGPNPPQYAVLPAPPSLTAALPYDYQKVLPRNTPLYARAPTPDEMHGFADWIAHNPNVAERLKEQSAQPPPRPLAPPKRLLDKKGRPIKGAKAPPVVKLPPPEPAIKLPEFVRLLLQPGFYVSVDGPLADPEGRALLRTVRGDVLQGRADTAVRASTLHGTTLGTLPLAGLALVLQGGAHSYTRDALTGRLQPSAALSQLEPIVLSKERVPSPHGELAVAQDGRLVPLSALTIIPHTVRPAFVPASARYIAVQLSSQTLVAYEGERPVYATLVSTGKTGFETPAGIFRIQHKHVSATMDGEVGAESYRIEDVPWTMYFSGSLALHAAFWHQGFGRTRSHGCVNLAPLDAHWLFDWATPTLPPGFHGVNTTRENPGTFVVIAP
jgi:hypothetical protein